MVLDDGAKLGPGSLLWTTAGDPRSLLSGATAGIMQLMYPGLGAGVSEHSDFFLDPFDRIFRSIPMIWSTIFADEDEAETLGHQIRGFHKDIKGVDTEGRSYHALDPEVFWWAHGTFTWEFFRARELFWPVPLNAGQKEQLYSETLTWYRRYGMSERPVPATYELFVKKFNGICSDILEMTPAAQWVLDPGSNPGARPQRLRLPGPLGIFNSSATHLNAEVVRLMVYGSMPDVVRRRFNFRWSNMDRIAFINLCATVRAASPAIGRGALDGMWPAGTAHLSSNSDSEVVLAGDSWRQRRDLAKSGQ